MSILEFLAASALLLGLVMYAVFAGADFGGGIWTALASGPRAREQREALFHAIGPVWETNHVWLIFVVVVLFTAFPKGFAPLFTALLTPLVIALVGINLRGAAFAFRHYGRETGRDVPLIARTFEISSVLTPFALGVAVTATATGRITVHYAAEAGATQWLTPFTVVGGVTGMAICAYLAPIYMTVRTTGGLQEDFRRYGMIAGLVLGMVTAAAIPLARADAPLFASRLLGGWPLACVALAVVAGSTTETMLWRRRYLLGQISAAATVTLTIAGFCAAMFPDLLTGQLSLSAAAAPRSTLIAFLSVLPFGIVVLAPSLILLYRVFRGQPDPQLGPEL
ncbi:cytochrome d ubiquinol oxidase subunit II [Geobacter sp. SVR]|uniref:cytochrome d ubiquinol oxidase subunit II n=1 Tax=Geobacter sp. SVR TaxID=2495594 RepID=UPI00143F0374|nr:cytochrome d ubiquinol oxidase subunit II [Geobacter sp. SVR]BCS53877.1 cytochrome D ubiquinol oxidase subunit II [Geobacter sp. SVR]GCF85614.1 cytochrome D ubiquinol oxidase subunit II [Geobacter sp. SVR]